MHDTARSDTAEYVDDRDLARRTPISRSQWQSYRHKGGGPPWLRVGKRCVYKWSDVQAWLEQHREVKP
jgi:hypothetical protein